MEQTQMENYYGHIILKQYDETLGLNFVMETLWWNTWMGNYDGTTMMETSDGNIMMEN